MLYFQKVAIWDESSKYPRERVRNYWILGKEDERIAISIEFQFEFRNAGNVAARHIHLPDKLSLRTKGKFDGPLTYTKTTDDITIGPGDNVIASMKVLLGKNSLEDVERVIEEFRSQDNEGITQLMSATYENELDASQKYKTTVQYRIHNNKAVLLKSEMINLSELDEDETEQN